MGTVERAAVSSASPRVGGEALAGVPTWELCEAPGPGTGRGDW